MANITAPTSARDALGMIHVALDALAATNPGQLDPGTLALILREPELDEAVLTAARAWSLSSFTARQGHSSDGDYSPKGSRA